MAVTGVYINVLNKATGEVKQVNVYNSVHDVDDGMYKMLIRTWTDDVGNVGEEDCFIAVTDNENSQEYKDFYSGWTFNDPKLNCVGTTDTVVHVLTEAGAPFSMYNWAWANYQQATGQNHVTLTSFDTAYTPSQKQLSRVNNAANAFFNCRGLTDITPFANLTAYGSGVNMAYMFYYCNKINNVDPLANWNTCNVTNMAWMFFYCHNLTNFDSLANWNTGNVTSIVNMFSCCNKIINVDPLANWNTCNVTKMTDAFCDCSKLTTLDGLANWNTGNVTNMANMFYRCIYIADIDGVAKWDTGNVTSMRYMFGNCRNVMNLEALSGWNTSSLTSTYSMFSHINYVNNASFLGGWNMASMTNACYMLINCQNLTCVSLPSSLANTANCNIAYMFRNCVNLAGNIFFRGAYVDNAANCFNGCSNYLKNIVANRKVDNGTYDQFYKSMGNAKTNSAWNANLYPLDPKITFNITDEAGEHSAFSINVTGMIDVSKGEMEGSGTYVFTGEWGDTVTYTVTGDGYTTVNGTVDLLLDDMTVDIHMYGEQHHVFTESEVLVGLDGGTIPMASWLDTTATNYNCVINDSRSDNGYSSWASMWTETIVGGSQTTYSVVVKAWDAGDATADKLETGRSVLIDSTGTFEDGTSATTSMYIRQTSDAPDEYLEPLDTIEVDEWGKKSIDVTKHIITNLSLASLKYSTDYSWITIDEVYLYDSGQTIQVSSNLVTKANPFGSELEIPPSDRIGTVKVTGTYSNGIEKTIEVTVKQTGGYDNYFYTKEAAFASYKAEEQITLDSNYLVTNSTNYVFDNVNSPGWITAVIQSTGSVNLTYVLTADSDNPYEIERYGTVYFDVTFEKSEYDNGSTTASYGMKVTQPTDATGGDTGGTPTPTPDPDPGYDGPDET